MPESVDSSTIAPHKARILAISGALILLHAAMLLIFWPPRWPVSYKWLLLPDGMGAYFLLGLGLQHLKDNRKSRDPGNEVPGEGTKVS